jgi:hypothetical protein
MKLLLVFDLDQTIIDTKQRFLYPENFSSPEAYKEELKTKFNPAVINIIKRVGSMRPEQVGGICLLTNNSAEDFVKTVDTILFEITGSAGKNKDGGFFDHIMMRGDPLRSDPENKTIDDIVKFVELLGISNNGLDDIMENSFFFDDSSGHKLFYDYYNAQKLDHYILIDPPFNILNKKDNTYFMPVIRALDRLQGIVTVEPEKKVPAVDSTIQSSMPSSNLLNHSVNLGYPRLSRQSSMGTTYKGGKRKIKKHRRKTRRVRKYIYV